MMRMKMIRRLVTVTVLLCLGAAHTIAETATASALNANKTSYPAAYFAQYSPRSALDIINRVPGFQLSQAENKRGLGQGGANILINGERVTGKTDIGSQLGRIAATNVIRVDIVDGASINIPGLSGTVANIITENKGLSRTWSWGPEFREQLSKSFRHIHFTVSGERGPFSYSAELRDESFRRGHWGIETLTDANGTVFESRDEKSTYSGDNPGIAVDLTWKPKDQHTGKLNLEYNQFKFREIENSSRQAVTKIGQTVNTVFNGNEDEWNATVGLDYEFPAFSGTLKGIAYYRFEHSPRTSKFSVFNVSSLLQDSSLFSQTADESEAILRSEYSWVPRAGRDWQVGLEGALNILDIESALSVLEDDVLVAQALPGATSRVEERRAELTATHTRTLTPQWDMQMSIGMEYSELSQTGGLTRAFSRPKGFISTTYKPYPDFAVRTKLEREVGQLSFFDFISSVSVSDDLDSAGNVNLKPQQNWLAELELDKDFGDGNNFKVRFYGSQISDLVDRIPIGASGDAVGNIDSAKQSGFDINATINSAKWGFEGIELKLAYDRRWSSVDDPLLGFSRRLNNDKKSYWEVSYRHDVIDTQWAYGASANQGRNAPSFRLNSIGQYNYDGPWAMAFVEHKNIFGVKVNLSVRNLFNGTDDFQRQFFTDRRDLGALDFTESRSRAYKPYYLIEFSGEF